MYGSGRVQYKIRNLVEAYPGFDQGVFVPSNPDYKGWTQLARNCRSNQIRIHIPNLISITYLMAAGGIKAGLCLLSLASGSATLSRLSMESTFLLRYLASTRSCSNTSHDSV